MIKIYCPLGLDIKAGRVIDFGNLYPSIKATCLAGGSNPAVDRTSEAYTVLSSTPTDWDSGTAFTSR